MRISSPHGEVDWVIVDDVEVSGYVAAELDRRKPEPVPVSFRALSARDDYTAVFVLIEAH